MQTLSLNLSLPSSVARDTLIIEQEKPGQADGYLSRAGMYLSILALINGEMPEDPECVNECTTTIYVYRYDLALAYRLAVSHGSLGSMEREDDLYYTEKIKVSMEDEIKFKYPCFGVVESRWIGGLVWDQDGSSIAAPGFVADVDKLRFAAPVYGTLAVTYKISRDKYSLALPKRETAIENKYSSVAFAVYPGGGKWEMIDPPPGAEATDQQCTGGGGGTTITPGAGGSSIPVSAHADRTITVDYCSQTITSDEATESIDWEYQPE